MHDTKIATFLAICYQPADDFGQNIAENDYLCSIMKKESYVAPESEIFGIDSMDLLMVNPSGGNIENPGDGGEDWEW